MEKSRRILELCQMLDGLENSPGFRKDGGNLSEVKLKKYNGKEIVLKKKKKENGKNNIDSTEIRYFLRESLNQIILQFPSILLNVGWNLFHYSDSNKHFVCNYRMATSFCKDGTLRSYLGKFVQTQQYILAYGIARNLKNINGVAHNNFDIDQVFVGKAKFGNPKIPNEMLPLFNSEYVIPYIDSKIIENTDQSESVNQKDFYNFQAVVKQILKLRKIPKLITEYRKLSELPEIYFKKDVLFNFNEFRNYDDFINYLEKQIKKPNKKNKELIYLDNELICSYKSYLDYCQKNSEGILTPIKPPDTSEKVKDESKFSDEELDNVMKQSRHIQTQQYIFIYGIARGMKHIYVNDVIHRDFKTENIFVSTAEFNNQYLIPLIADLGLAKTIRDKKADQSICAGSPAYQAPEQLGSYNYSFPVDVYAYALVVSDILQFKTIPETAFPQIYAIYANKIRRGERPLIDLCTNAQKKFIENMWCHEPSDRPTFIQIVNYLEQPLMRGELPKGFIFDDVDLDVVARYKEYIDSNAQNREEKSLHDVSGNEIKVIVDRLPKQNSANDSRNLGQYLITSMSTLPIDANPREFYMNKGEEFERKNLISEALSSYKRAATYGSKPAMTRIALLLLKSPDREKEGRELLEYLSGDGDRQDMIEKGALFHYAELMRYENIKKSASLFEESGKYGHPKGYIMAGQLNREMADECTKVKNAIKFLSRAKKCYSWAYIRYNDEESLNIIKEIVNELKVKYRQLKEEEENKE